MVSEAVARMRREGRAYLARNPRSFGRGGSSGGGSSSSTPSKVTQVSPGLWKYRDPKTGKTSFTSSKEFAQSSAAYGTPQFTQEFQKTYRSGTSRGSGTPIAFASESSARASINQAQATIVAERSRIAQAKTQAERNRIAQNIVMGRAGQLEFNRMLNFRSNLIKQGAKENKVTSTNQAGNKIVVSNWRLNNGDRVERVVNKTEGTTTYTTFSKGRKTGGVSMGSFGASSNLTGGVKITKSSNPNKLIVVLPNGVKGTINASGRVVIGKVKGGGNSYTFQDGVLRKVNGVAVGSSYKLKPTGKRIITQLEIKAGLTQKDIDKGHTIESSGLTEADVRAGLTVGSVGGINVINSDDVFNLAFLASGVSLSKFAIKKIIGLPKNLKLWKDTIKIRSSGKGGVKKQLGELLKFKQGQLASAYLKAKNSQLGDKTAGTFVTVPGKLSSRILKELNKKLRSININPKDVTLTRYLQSFIVPSNIARTEALIKMLKTGRLFTQKQLKNIPLFFNFKREGVLVTKVLPNGQVKVVAMEFNRVGNKISHISYKVGTGADTYAVVSTFKKIRKLSTIKGIRVKHTGTATIKSKVIKQEQLAEDVKKTVSQMKTKKVFLNGKRLDKKEIKLFSDVLKSQSRLAANKKLGSVIANLYKKSPDYNISGITNVIRIKRTLNKIIINSGKKKDIIFGVHRKGDFLEVGFTKKRLASNRKIQVLSSKISSAGSRKVVQSKAVDRLGKTKIDNTIRVIAKGVSKSTQKLVQLEVKKGATASQVSNIKNAVMSIQTIVRPVLRSSKQTLTKSKVVAIKSNVQKMLPALSRTSKTSLVALSRSLVATQQISRLAHSPIQKSISNTMTKRVLVRFSGLKPLSIKPLKKPFLSPKPKPFFSPRHKPKPKPLPKPKPFFKLKTKKAKTRKLSSPVMTYGFVIKRAGKMVRLNIPPMTLKDAWDTGSYVLDHRLQRTGKLIPVGLNNVVAKLGKNVAGYLGKHQKKFRRVRIKKGKGFALDRTIIEKQKYAQDLASERRALKLAKKRATTKRKPSRRAVVKRKPVRRASLPTLNQLRNKKRSLTLKRKAMLLNLKKRARRK